MLIRLVALGTLKLLASLFFRFRTFWVGPIPADRLGNARIGCFLNHTSLFDLIFFAAVPWSTAAEIARRGILPGADVTLSRPIVGRIIRFFAGNVVPISRKRDETWDAFLNALDEKSLVLIAPEGRMKRLNGLDKNGEPMTVRGGIVDLMQAMGKGKMVLAYSHGLHHVQAPGERLPRLFQRATIAFEALEIEDYLRSFGMEPGSKALKVAVCRDLERRRDLHC